MIGAFGQPSFGVCLMRGIPLWDVSFFDCFLCFFHTLIISKYKDKITKPYKNHYICSPNPMIRLS